MSWLLWRKSTWRNGGTHERSRYHQPNLTAIFSAVFLLFTCTTFLILILLHDAALLSLSKLSDSTHSKIGTLVSQQKKEFAIVLFLTSCEDVTYCELTFTLLRSLSDLGAQKIADIVLLVLEDQASILREEMLKLGATAVIETTVPVEPPKKVKGFIENTDFAKLRVWELEEYKKIVLLDSDTIVLRPIDDLFLFEEFASTPGGFSPLNCGFLTLKPSKTLFNEMISIISNPTMFDFATGWNHTGVKGFKGGMKGKLPSAATCQGFLHFFFHQRQSTNRWKELQDEYVCDCSCLTKDEGSLWFDKSSNSVQNYLMVSKPVTHIIHFSGPCKPFPLKKPIKVRTQQRILLNHPIARAAADLWKELHSRSLLILGNATQLASKGLGIHDLVSDLAIAPDNQKGTDNQRDGTPPNVHENF